MGVMERVEDGSVCRKTFLSTTPNEYGSIATNFLCRIQRKDGRSNYHCIDADVRITDCSEAISLDFSVASIKQYAERMDKMDRLIGELVLLRNRMRDAKDEVEKHDELRIKEGYNGDD